MTKGTDMTDTITEAQGCTLLFESGADLARALTNATLFASKDKARPVLNMVRFTIDGDSVLLESTDSYAMIRETITAESADGTPAATFMVTRDVVIEVAKVAKSSKFQPVGMTFSPLAPEGQKVTFTIGTRTIAEGWTEATHSYPDASRLWADWITRGIAEIGFHGEDLVRIGKVSAEVSKRDRGDVAQFCFNDAGKPAIVRIGKSIDILQMPGKWAPRF